MTAKTKSPWRMFLPLASVILIFIAWSGYWQVADGVARRAAEAERTRLAGRGVTLACDGENWGGYPFRFEFNCGRPLLTLDNGTTVKGTALLSVAQAYNPMHVITLVDGPTIAVSPEGQTFVVNHDRAIISTVLKGKGLPQISAEAANVTVPGLLSAADIQLHTRTATGRDNDVAFTAQRLALAFPGNPPLAMDDARLVGTLTSGQVYHIGEITFVSGAVKLWGKGEVSLDSQNRPSGVIHAQTNDPQGLLKLLDPYLHMNAKQRAMFESLLVLLGDGAKADIVAKNGELFIGPMKVGDLRPVDHAL
jgi:hypothetical protein